MVNEILVQGRFFLRGRAEMPQKCIRVQKTVSRKICGYQRKQKGHSAIPEAPRSSEAIHC